MPESNPAPESALTVNKIECVALRPILADKDGKSHLYRAGDTLSLPDYEVERYILKGVVQSPDAPLPEGLRSPQLIGTPLTPEEPKTPAGGLTQKLNINNANLPELLALPGVKAAQAKAIVENRPYAAVEQVAEKIGLDSKAIEKWNAEVVPLIEV